MVKPGMIENLLYSLRTMRKRGIFLTVLGTVLAVVSYLSRDMELRGLPMELFSMISACFFLYGLIIAVHNTNALAPMFFSFRYTKAKFFTRKKMDPVTRMDPDADDYVSVDDGGFHYELYSDYLRDRRKWSGMAASFFLAGVYFLLTMAVTPLIL